MRGKRKAKLFVAIVRPEPKRFRPKTWNAIPPRGTVHKIEPVTNLRLGHAARTNPKLHLSSGQQ